MRIQEVPAPRRVDAVLKAAVLATLTGAYVVVVFVFTLAVLTRALGWPGRELTPPPWALPALGHVWALDLAFIILLGPPAGVTLVALVVVLFTTPAAFRWLQRGVNVLIDAEHDDPFSLITRLDPHLRAMDSTQAILPTIAATIAQTLKLPYVAIVAHPGVGPIDEESTFPLAAEYGAAPADVEEVSLPLVYQGTPIGTMRVAARRRGETLSQSDLRVLNDLARQVGISLYAARLTGDLQRSRVRLVTAREEERRRIRRDLHDGLGPTLANFAMQLERAREQLPAGAEEIDTILARLTEQSQATIGDIRRLVYELRPPDLDEFGLVPALREYLHRVQPKGTCILLDAAADLPNLSAAVEVATYRIVQEAVNNAVKHAAAHRIAVAIRVERAEMGGAVLTVRVEDDGAGLPANPDKGIGLRSMRERAAELGGSCVIANGESRGVSVLARLPLPPEELSVEAGAAG